MQTLNRLIPCSLRLAALALLCGCATTPRTADMAWIELFGPAIGEDAAPGSERYGPERLARDTQTYLVLLDELGDLEDELSTLRRTLLQRPTPYITSRQNDASQVLLLRYAQARGALWEVLRFYRDHDGTDAEVHHRGAVLAMSAALQLAYHSSRGIALFHDQPDIVRMMNAPHPRLDLPGGMYDQLYDSVTAPDHLEMLEVVWYLFCRDLGNPQSTLSHIREHDPLYGPLIREMDRVHADMRIQTDYILHAGALLNRRLANRLHHSQIAALGDKIASDVSAGLYSARGVVFRDVARIKKPGGRLLNFSAAQVDEVKALLQPGDIILTFTGGYMSNVFLPGTFKHGITYIGSVAQRRALGLSDLFLKERAVSPAQAEALHQRVRREQLASGAAVDVIEAVAEGVIMNSLETLLATHVNRLAVIRPVLTVAQRRDQLLALLQYVDAPYDFNFDFQDDRRQCCTELIYRTTTGKGPVGFELVQLKGMWILAADDLLRYALDTNPSAFDVVLLADRAPDDRDYRARIRTGEEGRQALYELMALPLPEPDQTSALGP